MLLNALVKSIFRCRFVEKRAKNMLPKVRVAADSKLCYPLASFRPRRIPNLASLLAVPFDANLTVPYYTLPSPPPPPPPYEHNFEKQFHLHVRMYQWSCWVSNVQVQDKNDEKDT